MKYFSRPTVAQAESAFVREEFGRRYEPSGPVSIWENSVLDTAAAEIVEVDGESLVIDAETAAWAFLSEPELAAFKRIRQVRFKDWKKIAPEIDKDGQGTFVATLYRRGLLSINGTMSLDANILRDSPNYNEGHLVELLITERCNLACPYCLAGASKAMPTMDREIGRRAIDLAFAMTEASTVAFEFAGGEPMLQYPLMKELVQYIQSHPARGNRRVFLSIQTNATLLTAERAQWLKENDIRVGISLDGTPASQNLSRPRVDGGKSFPLLMKGVDLLQRYEVPFGALVVLNRSNVGSVPDLVDFLLENGIHGFRLNPIAYIGNARQNWNDFGLSQEEIVSYLQELIQHIAGNGLLLLEDNVRSMCDFLTSVQRRTRCMRSECGAGDSFQAVAANGDIYPCGRATQSPGLRLGNIFEKGITSLSGPAAASPIIEEIRSRRPAGLSDCVTCYYRQLCQSGCSAQAWESYKTVRHKTPECHFYKTMYPYLMRWLSFEGTAFEALNRTNYFAGGGERFDFEFATSAGMEGVAAQELLAVP